MRALCGLVAVAALAATAPGPAAAVRALLQPGGADPFGPLVAATALLAWALVGWVLLVVLATLAARLPGTLGWAAAAVTRRLAPAAVRRLVGTALGVTVVAGGLGATPAAADPAPPAPRAAVAVSLDWPGTVPAPDLDWPAPEPSHLVSPARPAATPPRSARPTSAGPVVVRPGDSLWAIAAAHLPAPSSAAIARSWPRWWSANRAAIGADPDLLHPGTRLVPPADPSHPSDPSDPSGTSDH